MTGSTPNAQSVCCRYTSPGRSTVVGKWGWFGDGDANVVRHRLKIAKWALTVFFLVLGFATLAAYIKIGIEHRDRYGERYVPAHLQLSPASSTGAGAVPAEGRK